MVINPGGTIASPINLVTVAASVLVANKLLAADTNNDFQITGDGKIQWGPGGAGALDTNLYRQSAGQLKTDGNLAIGGVIKVAAGNTIQGDGVAGNIQFTAGQLTCQSAVFMMSGGVGINSAIQNFLAANEATAATAGANGAPPAQVAGYLIAKDHNGTTIKIPYYAN